MGALVVLLGTISTGAYAQSGGSIAGVVKDTTGAVLPGVTVEASSPALSERVRTVTTDSEGLYKIVDLRPGVYTVNFALEGFNTFRREGIELTSGITVTANADLRVGALEETLTVSGQAPTVDIHNVQRQQTMTREVIEALPTGQRSIQNLGALIPGVVQTSPDVGGTSLNNGRLMIHGSRDTEMGLLVDGLYANNGQARGGAFMSSRPADGATQEVVIVTDNMNAESDLGSVITNIVPKDGGNRYTASLAGSYANPSWQSDNLDDDLRSRGVTAVNKIDALWEILPAAGGPIRKDKMWFYLGIREFRMNLTVPNLVRNVTPQALVYTPDPTKEPVIDDTFDAIYGLRLTTQATPRNKFAVYYSMQREIRKQYYSQSVTNSLRSPEAMTGYDAIPDYLAYATWTSPVTSRLLLQAGAAFTNKDWNTTQHKGNPVTDHPIQDLSSGMVWGNSHLPFGHQDSHQFNTKFTVNYVTGSHAFKFGNIFQNAASFTTQDIPGNGVVFQVRNGVPTSVVVYATPLRWVDKQKAMIGTFAQDQWTVKQLTVNAGIRYDWFNSYVPESTQTSGPLVPNRNVTFAQVNNVPNWKNWSPRLGTSYDVFGNGKTALKVSLGKYLEGPNLITYTRLANPAASIAVSATRSWGDANGNGVPDCDLVSFPANGECGPNNNLNFGNSVVTTRYADDVPTTRMSNWQFGTGIQHELLPSTSVSVGYFRRWYNNLRITQNRAVTNADFSPFCVPVPVDARLPGGGGNQLCGFYDVSPAPAGKFGQVNNYVSEISHWGKAEDVYDGVDMGINARLGRGIIVGGGMSIGRERTDYCAVKDDLSVLSLSALSTPNAPNTSAQAPHTTPFCDVHPPFQPNVKSYGVYPLPWWDIQTSATFQSMPGPMVTAQWAVPNALVVPTLGRNLAAGPNSTVNVDLIPPGTMYSDRLYQLDWRLSKKFSMRGSRLQTNLDFFNALNANPPVTVVTTYGQNWQRPQPILLGRVIKVSAQIDF